MYLVCRMRKGKIMLKGVYEDGMRQARKVYVGSEQVQKIQVVLRKFFSDTYGIDIKVEDEPEPSTGTGSSGLTRETLGQMLERLSRHDWSPVVPQGHFQNTNWLNLGLFAA